MAKKKSRDIINLSLLTTQAVLFVAIVVPTLLRVENQQLKIEFRYNFLKNYVEKVEWYWLYLPALIALSIVIINILIVNYAGASIDKVIIRTYLASSLVALIFLTVVTYSMQSAIGL